MVEQQLDREIEHLDNLGADDLENIRKKRIEEMKARQKNMSEWKAAGHGEYTELASQQEFFDANKKVTFFFFFT